MNFIGEFVQTSRQDGYIRYKKCDVFWVGQAPLEKGGESKWHVFAICEGTSYSISVHETELEAKKALEGLIYLT